MPCNLHAEQLAKLLEKCMLYTNSAFLPNDREDIAISRTRATSSFFQKIKKREIGNYLVRDVRAVSVSVKASAGANYGR